jgi:hypothetical protein
MSSNNKDYTTMTREELVSEEKEVSGRKITTAVFIGLLVGIAFYAAVQGKFFLTLIVLFFAFRMGSGYSQNLKRIQEEISSREAEQ